MSNAGSEARSYLIGDLEVAAPVPDGDGVGGAPEAIHAGDCLRTSSSWSSLATTCIVLDAVGEAVVDEQLLRGDRVERLGEGVSVDRPLASSLNIPRHAIGRTTAVPIQTSGAER